MQGNASPTAGPDMNPPWDGFPVTNRATRRHCAHQFKTIGERTACVHCGKDR